MGFDHLFAGSLVVAVALKLAQVVDLKHIKGLQYSDGFSDSN